MNAPPISNLLLAGLPDADYQRVVSALEPVELPPGRTLLPSSGTLDRFYFVNSGLISLLHTTEDGESAEIAIVGNEGGVGLALILGGHPFPAQAVVQASSVLWSLRADVLQREFDQGGELQRNLLKFTQALMTQMAHTVVCNRHHSVELQLCRWILLSLDRLPTNELQMTQETIAHMLGVRRAGVTEAMSRLQRDGLVEHRRGQVRVCDRAALEARACECYQVIKREYVHLQLHTGATEKARAAAGDL